MVFPSPLITTVSVPVPAVTVSTAEKSPDPIVMLSSPLPVVTLSSPAPTLIVWFPAPVIVTVSFPAPDVTELVPEPITLTVSFPAPEVTVEFPSESNVIVSSELPAVSVVLEFPETTNPPSDVMPSVSRTTVLEPVLGVVTVYALFPVIALLAAISEAPTVN